MRYAGTQVLGCVYEVWFVFFFFFFFLVLVEEKEKEKGKRKRKKKEEEEEDRYGRTLVVSLPLILQKRKTKSLFFLLYQVGRYLLYNVSSYTYTHFFFLFSFLS